MTQLVLTETDVDEFVRERVDTVLVGSLTHTDPSLHLRSEDQWGEPPCKTTVQRPDGWRDKPITVFPPDYYPFCPICVEARFGVEVIDDGE